MKPSDYVTVVLKNILLFLLLDISWRIIKDFRCRTTNKLSFLTVTFFPLYNHLKLRFGVFSYANVCMCAHTPHAQADCL